MTQPRVQALGVSTSFERADGGELPVLRGVHVHAGAGEFVSIVGPSGCGKSTLCNVISGVTRPDRGRILIDGADVSGRVGLVGYMPQKDLLLPWRTVLDNVVLGLEIMGVPRAEARAEALPLFDEFGLADFESAYPYALSGGMRQRAAFMRTRDVQQERPCPRRALRRPRRPHPGLDAGMAGSASGPSSS